MAGSEVLISVEGVSKKYCRSLRKSIRYGLTDITNDLLGRDADPGKLRDEEFWALNDISFELRRGECLGLIGSNGAGKSTLLKLLSGIILPDAGRVSLKGKVGALIELGAGFHPLLSGRENIRLSAAIHGMTSEEIDRKFDSIIEFSELGEFIDAPVVHYSSGMRVRLGFAIAVHVEPDILLLDEVLAVGDVGFRTKCLNAIGEIMKNTAVILVSHNMPQIARMATHAMVLDHGSVVSMSHKVVDAITEYYSLFDRAIGRVTVEHTGQTRIQGVMLSGQDASGFPEVGFNDDLLLEVSLEVDPAHESPVIFVGIQSQELQIIAQCSNEWDGVELTPGKHRVSLLLEKPSLNPGNYFLLVTIMDHQQSTVLSQHFAMHGFHVVGEHIGFASFQLRPKWNLVS